jgi:ubiquinone/menaquinone biosynthesis C-methylase UbiE
MENTGERFLANIESAVVSYEHWHRYMYASNFVYGKKVLDIASGEGYGSYYLSKNATSVTGVDISEDAVLHAQKTYKKNNLEYKIGSAAKIPIEGEHIFDVIVSFETIEHITEPDQNSFMREVKRLLKPEGTLIISTPDKKYYTDMPGICNEFHLREFYEDEFRGFLEKDFSYVSFLGQKVTAGSYIWDTSLESHLSQTETHLIGLEKGKGFVKAKKNNEQVYFVAICSQKPHEVHESVLIDTSSVLLTELEQKIDQLTKKIQYLTHNKSLLESLETWRFYGQLERIKFVLLHPIQFSKKYASIFLAINKKK